MEKKHFPESIRSSRVTLKKHSADLAQTMFNYVDQDRERLLEFLPWVKFTNTVQDEINFIKMTHDQWERHEGYGYGIFLNADETYIGNVGVHSISWIGDRCEIGYWILGNFEGHGYMTEATAALTNEAFKLGFNRVEIHCDPANVRSANVPRRLGFLFEAKLKGHTIDHRGMPRDTFIFARLKSDGLLDDSKMDAHRDSLAHSTNSECVFCKILSGSLPGNFVYKGDRSSAFLDIHPINDGHILVLPNVHVRKFSELDELQIADLFSVGQKIYHALQASGIRCEGANFFISEGAVAGQEVEHVHLHIVPRFTDDGQNIGFKHAAQIPREKLQGLATQIDKRI